MGDLIITPVTRGVWDDLLRLFGENGAYSNCWCTWWLVTSGEWDGMSSGDRRRMLSDLVESADPPPGLLAMSEGSPLGWCAVGPRERYDRMMSARARTYKRIDDRPSWVANCFYVDRAARGRGIASELLRAAVGFAKRNGATLLEAFPIDVDVKEPGPAGLFVGTLAMFEEAGFTEVARFGDRPLVRLEL